jgi:hypothetical protein
MAQQRIIRIWKLFAAIGLLLCLPALMAHSAQLLSATVLLLFPVLLFGFVLVPPSFWPAGARQPVCKPRLFARESLFQRPPPRFSR